MQTLTGLSGCILAQRANLMLLRRPLRLAIRLRYARQQTAMSSVSTDKAAATSSKADQGNSPKKGKGKDNDKRENTSSADEIRALRLGKVEQLRQLGKEPYAYRFDRTDMTDLLQRQYRDLPAGEVAEGKPPVSIAGRITARRFMGKLAFATLTDERGEIQLYLEKKALDANAPDSFKHLKTLMDIGDIVGVTGSMKRTDKGELSIVAQDLQILTKSLLPLPDKYYGLADVELRHRQRYLDMIVTDGVRETFRKRSKVMSSIRQVLDVHGFLEVETPVLESTAGGADAKPFVTYHNALERNYTLRIATELHLKRMIVGGFERVFEIGRIFRNEGISSRHNPEFTSVELYQAYADYTDMMTLTERIIRDAAKAVCGTTSITYQGDSIDLEQPFRRASMHELVQEHLGVHFLFGASGSSGIEAVSLQGLDFTSFDSLEATKAAAKEALQRSVADTDGTRTSSMRNIDEATSSGRVLAECFEAAVESSLQQPTFVLDFPVEISPLAKPHRSKPGLVERFELYIAGRELANSFSELTDPIDQRQRLEAQVSGHQSGGQGSSGATGQDPKDGSVSLQAANANQEVGVDEDFLTALEYGMPPTGGMGMGLDRLVMLLTDKASIREVIAFPLLK